MTISVVVQELKRERAKAVAALAALQQKLEEKHKLELDLKVQTGLFPAKSLLVFFLFFDFCIGKC